MMHLLHPTYTLKVEVKDVPSMQSGGMLQGGVGQVAVAAGPGGFVAPMGNGQKYFNPGANKIGCDEVLVVVRDALLKAGIPANVTFERFEHK